MLILGNCFPRLPTAVHSVQKIYHDSSTRRYIEKVPSSLEAWGSCLSVGKLPLMSCGKFNGQWRDVQLF